MRYRKKIHWLFLVAFLAACGGGGSSSDSAGTDNTNDEGTDNDPGTGNEAPTVSITSFDDGDTFYIGAMVEFRAAASDPDGSVSSISWSSDVDGSIGSGASFNSDTLSPGSHVITVSAEDDEGATAEDSASIVVEPDLNAFAGWRSITTGNGHACGMAMDGTGYCWGWDSSSSVFRSHVPELVEGRHVWESLSAGGAGFACGTTISGDAWCWGSNVAGQLGTGDELPREKPALVSGGYEWKSVIAGNQHACGVTVDGDGYCWGSNSSAQLGNADFSDTNRSEPVPVVGGYRWREIVARGDSSCGITVDDQLYCWGTGIDRHGFTLSSIGISGEPIHVEGDWSAVSRLSLRYSFQASCAIEADDGALECWEHVGDDGFTPSEFYEDSINVRMSGVADVSVGPRTGCGIQDDGTGFCWGNGAYGQLGNGRSGRGDWEYGIDPYHEDFPVLITGDREWKQVSVSTDVPAFVCGVTTSAEAYCWGYGRGALGNDTDEDINSVPVEVADPVVP